MGGYVHLDGRPSASFDKYGVSRPPEALLSVTIPVEPNTEFERKPSLGTAELMKWF